MLADVLKQTTVQDATTLHCLLFNQSTQHFDEVHFGSQGDPAKKRPLF